MKQLYYVLLLLLGLALRPTGAQAQTTDSLSQKLTSIFANIDKSQVPTRYLYEAGVRFLPLSYYNGTLSDSNRTDMNVLRYLHAQLLSSRVYGDDTLPSLPAFNARLQAVRTAANGAIPLAIEYHPYASIRPDAIQNNLLSVQNEQVFDVAGRSYSPYAYNKLFVAAPEQGYAPTNTVSFLFRRNLYLTSDGSAPLNLYLDFGDGRGYQPATWGQPLSTTYGTAGLKRVKVKAYFGWQTLESHFDFNVQSVAVAARYDPAYGFTAHFGPGNQRPGALVSVRYGAGHGPHVVKPFIIVEQYNIAGAAPHLVKCNNANNTIETFLPKIGPDFTATFDFENKLQAAGYDLVYIDFDRNTDDITLNAKVVEQVVQEINARKQTSFNTYGLAVEQNVVMGMSMGGLIARYALAEMTKNNFPFGPPDTRLLVLHDSPQRGAYNPVGLQSFTRSTDVPLNVLSLNPFGNFLSQPKLRDFDDRLSDAVNVLDEPASQQLGILNAFNGRGDIRTNTFIDGVYKDMVDFTLPANASGPQPAYPIVATSDGSQCGRGSGAPVGVLLSSADTYTNNWLAPIAAIIPFSLGVRGAAYGLPAYGQQALISRMRVYFEYRIRIGIGFFTVTIPIRFNLLNESAPSPPSTLPYETLPGGFTNLAAESGDCGTTSGIASAFLKTSLYNGPICFVPSYSALDVPTVTTATAFSKYINNLTDNPSLPRVARFVAQEASSTTSSATYNLNHLTFTARNSEWIFDEMQLLPHASNYCSSECLTSSDLEIKGPGTLCGTSTYSSPVNGLGVTYSWTASPANAFTVATGNNSTFQTANVPGVNTTGTITLTINTGCQTTFTKTVVVGAPAVPTFIQRDPSDMCYSGTAYYTTTNYDPTVTYTIRAVGATAIRDPGGFRLKHTGSGYVSFTVTATNNCGTQTANGEVTFDCASAFTYAVYPNPAANTLTVKQNNRAGTAPHNSGKFTVRLHDNHGTLHVQKAANTATLQLAVDTLPTGLYLLRIESEGEAPESHQIQITH